MPFDKTPYFWSAQGQQLRYAGYGAGYEDVIIRGNPDALKVFSFSCSEWDDIEAEKSLFGSSSRHIIRKAIKSLRWLACKPTHS